MGLRTILQCIAAMALGLGLTAGTVNAQTNVDDVQTSAELKLGEQQISKIRKYFAGASAGDRPAEVASIAVSVGAKAPDTIETAPLPGAILAELPAGVDYQYFLRGEDLVILNAESRMVLAIVPKAG